MPEEFFRVDEIVKTYPGVTAIDHVSFSVRQGEIHALIGENGAGKSTLIKILSGAITPDSGKITFFGKEYSSMTPKLSQSLGVQVIYQEFTSIPTLSAAENVFLGEKTSDGMFVDMKDREERARKLFQELHVNVDPSAKVRDLSPASKQIVEIAKAVHKNVKLLIMDEPTAPLTSSEVDVLFSIVRKLKSQGVTIIFISHRLEELFEIADRITVMRDACYIGTKDIKDVTRNELITMMAGRELKETYPTRSCEIGEEMLRVEHLYGNGDQDISFTLHKGEILGFAGLVGSGRTELMRVIYGAEPAEKGKIFIEGQETKIRSCHDAIEKGIGLIPEDRKTQGVFLNHSIEWNTAINAIKSLSNLCFVNGAAVKKAAENYRDKFAIKTPSLDQKVKNLSGGNQQKVVLAKTLAANCKIIIFDEPTRGIDVEAKQEIYKLMNDLAEQGNAILMVSSDMPELIGMSDRIMVMCENHLGGEVPREKFDQNYILDLASGGQQV